MKRYTLIWLLVLFGLVPHQASAVCAPGLIPFSYCDILDRDTSLYVCHSDFVATYWYGTLGEVPELYLSEPIATVDYQPSDGEALVGTITFYNDNYAYEVLSGFTSEFSDQGLSHFGGVTVLLDGKPLTKLECVPEQVDGVYWSDLYDLKVAAGLQWYGGGRGWLPADDPD